MSDELHVVFGAGQVGRAVAHHLGASGRRVRAVSRRRPAALDERVDWRSVDLTDPEAACDAATGATVVYQCLNAPYTQWPRLFPPLQRAALAAAVRTEALLVTLENVYGYGPTSGAPMTEDLPLAATSSKGRTRAAMTEELMAASAAGNARIAIGRASDFFGAGARDSTLGGRVFANALAGRRADVLGDPDLMHTYSYVPDIAIGLVTLGTDERAVGGVWHLPGPETVSTRAVVAMVAEDVGHPVAMRRMPTRALRVLGTVSPMMRGLAQMAYEFEQPFILDTAKFEATFAIHGTNPTCATPLVTAVHDTVAWYRGPGRSR